MVPSRRALILILTWYWCSHCCNCERVSKNDGTRRTRQLASDRVIGGETAPEDGKRFPYIALFASGTNGDLCQGSLIAPELVLTTATCVLSMRPFTLVRLGVSDRNKLEDEYLEEWVASDKQRRIHPRYVAAAAANTETQPLEEYNYGIFSFHGKSRIRPLALHSHHHHPQVLQDIAQELTLLGYARPGGRTQSLQTVRVWYVPTPQCRTANATDSQGIWRDYAVLMGNDTTTLLCAATKTDKRGQCEEDQGAPLIFRSQNRQRRRPHRRAPDNDEDLLVGMAYTFFGDCRRANGKSRQLPDLYVRVSAGMDWIQDQLCKLSRNVGPSSTPTISCPSRPTFSPPPSQNLVTLRVEFTTDFTPLDTGWLLQSAFDGTVYANVPPGSYKSNQDFQTLSKDVQVPSDTRYVLTVLDSFGDGWRGSYRVSLVTPTPRPGGGGNMRETLQLLLESEPFAFLQGIAWKGKIFTVGKWNARAAAPTPLPSSVPSSAPSMAPSEAPPLLWDASLPFLKLTLQLDNRPMEISWTLESITQNVTLLTREFGYYENEMAQQTVVERVNIPPTDLYRFVLQDQFNSGLNLPPNVDAFVLSYILVQDDIDSDNDNDGGASRPGQQQQRRRQEVILYRSGAFEARQEVVVFGIAQPRECRQDRKATFVFRKQRTCQWLSTRDVPLLNRICADNQTKAAQTCPQTCGTCHVRSRLLSP